MNRLYIGFQKALNKFITQIKRVHKENLLGILVTGSFVKKKINNNSDIDLFMIIKDKGVRIRGVKIIDNIEIEYFMNPKRQIEADIEKEKGQLKQTVVNIFKDGKIIYDKDGSLRELKKKANEIFKIQTRHSEFYLFSFKYFISDYLKDVEDSYAQKDFLAFEYNTNLLINHLIEGFCKLKDIPLKKPKYLKSEMKKKDSKFIILLEEITKTQGLQDKIQVLKKLSQYVLDIFGGPLPREYEIKNKTTY